MRFVWIAGGLIVLSGCAPSLVGGNQVGGVVDNVRSHGIFGPTTADAFAIADAHCQKFGKAARIGSRINETDQISGTVTFDCVSTEGVAESGNVPLSSQSSPTPNKSVEAQPPTPRLDAQQNSNPSDEMRPYDQSQTAQSAQ